MPIHGQKQCWKISLSSWTNSLFLPFDILLCPKILSFLNSLNSCLLTHCFHPPMWILNYWSILRHHDSLADKWGKLDTDEQFAYWHKECSFKIAQMLTNSSQNQPGFSCWIKGPNFLFSHVQLETRILGCHKTVRMKNPRSQPHHIFSSQIHLLLSSFGKTFISYLP